MNMEVMIVAAMVAGAVALAAWRFYRYAAGKDRDCGGCSCASCSPADLAACGSLHGEPPAPQREPKHEDA
jgi:hypothetical protein